MKDETLIKAVEHWFKKNKNKNIHLMYHQHYFKNENGIRKLFIKHNAIYYKFWFDENNVLRREAYV